MYMNMWKYMTNIDMVTLFIRAYSISMFYAV